MAFTHFSMEKQQLIDHYRNQQAQCEAEALASKKKRQSVSVLRLVVFLGLIAWIWFLWNKNPSLIWGGSIVLIAAFLLLVRWYEQINFERSLLVKRATLNEKEAKALTGEKDLFGNGEEFVQPTHRYAHDLDLFGPHAIFGWLNRANMNTGRAVLANWLTSPILNAEQIQKRQQGFAELANKEAFRQDFWVKTAFLKEKEDRLTFLARWAKLPTNKLKAKSHPFALWVFPPLSLAATVSYSFDIITFGLLLLLLLLPLFYYGLFIKTINAEMAPVSKAVATLKALSLAFQKIEKQNFKTDYLKQLTKSFSGSNKASLVIDELVGLTERFDQRNNFLLAIPLNVYALWDIRYALKINQWKQEHGKEINEWLSALAELEAALSIATMHYNHPNFCVPQPTKEPKITADDLGHPLLADEERVTNSVSLKTENNIVVLTGANMAGKSTFLRTLGVNLVLAMMGASVCATGFQFRPIDLYTGMRTNDSLDENTSYFFAELKRLAAIVKRLEAGNPCYLLLDEILKGTNSKDKEEGSKKLIKRLLSLKAGGIIATHDLGLCSLEQVFPNQVRNKAFETLIKDDELEFDYKLRDGICQTMNASFLMKKMGITPSE